MSDQVRNNDPAFMFKADPQARRQFAIAAPIVALCIAATVFSVATGRVSLNQFWTSKGVQVAAAR